MNKIIIILLSMLSVSCGSDKKETKKEETVRYEAESKSPEELGKDLFEGTGNCFACHKPDQKIIAPSLQEIAKIYKGNNGDMVAFLKEKADPIVDPSQYETMRTNFAITKSMSDAELHALAAYIYSFAK
jgi:cytochrome c